MSQLKAVLGPTNTGKTHYAIERMLGHSSGMIGLPLRLLAREVYDKVVARKGAASAALITGEERIWPKTARYFVCTVEAMPVHQPVEFMAIDEIQLAQDTDRGHIFTDRLLHARGTGETLLLGADTMRPILRQLDLDVDTQPRERFSELAYAGPIKVTKLPKRSAIVAFSSEEVYAIAELLRRQKGGAAVIMGALSPRTRNAQVELYQSGEVDYLVATDAIGMGLNLDVDHIAFAASTKFDGRRHRHLRPSEMAQIAGRAGRFRAQGTFGETADCKPFDDDLVARIENHRFEPVETLEWRNSSLDFQSLSTLMHSLARPSGNVVLRQNPNALDEWTLRRIALEPEIEAGVVSSRHVRRLWDLCRLPDFRKAGHEGHFRLVQSIAEHLIDPDARMSDKAMTNRMDRLSQPVGDIPGIQEKLAAIRTWTYAAYRDDWLENAPLWREKARQLEDRLSDALHEALTARFVDRRTTALLAGLEKDHALMTDLTPEGEISVEGHIVGHLKGLTFEPETNARTLEGKALRTAAGAALVPILTQRLIEIAAAQEDAFTLSPAGEVIYDGHSIARMTKGNHWLAPNVELLGATEISADQREPARTHIEAWVMGHIAKVLPAHMRVKAGEGMDALTGHARGIAFRIMESGAAIDLREDDPSLRIETDQREVLKSLGLRAGRMAAHSPDAQKPASQRLIAHLRTLYDGVQCLVAPEGAGSFALDGSWPEQALLANGYLRFGPRAVRADLAERLAWEISKRRKEADKNLFALPPELASIVSCPGETFPAVLKGFGLVPAEKDPETGVPVLWRYGRRLSGQGPRAGGRDAGPTSERGEKSRSERPKRGGKPSRPAPRREKQADPDSPFAALAALMPAEAPKKKRKPKKKKLKAAPEAVSDAVSLEVAPAPKEAESPKADTGQVPQPDTKTDSASE